MRTRGFYHLISKMERPSPFMNQSFRTLISEPYGFFKLSLGYILLINKILEHDVFYMYIIDLNEWELESMHASGRYVNAVKYDSLETIVRVARNLYPDIAKN
jgi:hypothetical protein